MKLCRRVRVCFHPLSFFHIKDERLVSKMEGKTNFRGAYRLSETGIDVFRIIDVGVIWNSLIAWPDWPWPPIFATDLCATDSLYHGGIESCDDKRTRVDKPHKTFHSGLVIVPNLVALGKQYAVNPCKHWGRCGQPVGFGTSWTAHKNFYLPSLIIAQNLRLRLKNLSPHP